MQFQIHRLRFRFRAEHAVSFPQGKAGNALRGGFGAAFRRLVCAPDCLDAKTCSRRNSCRYAQVFEPLAQAGGPSGFAQLPRPFVFRPAALDGKVFAPGARFEFDLHVFERDPEALQSYVEALSAWGGRRAFLEDVDRSLVSIDLLAPASATASLRVEFVTPTELKAGHEIAAEPTFGVLMSRVRDRVSTLSALYGNGPVPLDFARFGERAARVEMCASHLEQVHAERVSSRTGQTHALDGFTGYADYVGDLAEFVPFLEAAQFTGVGRQTTWGKGEIRVERHLHSSLR